MKAIFIESSIFAKLRCDYMSDEEYRQLQQVLLMEPHTGDVIQGTGGLRKIPLAFIGPKRPKEVQRGQKRQGKAKVSEVVRGGGLLLLGQYEPINTRVFICLLLTFKCQK